MHCENTLWYDKPASKWDQALPIGNGRLGAMIFGQVDEEKICLNEDTLYGNDIVSRINPDAYDTVKAVRDLLNEKKIHQAYRLAQTGLCGVPRYFGPYLPLSNLFVRFEKSSAPAVNYRRELNLRDSMVTISYVKDNVTYMRRVFASFPDNIICLYLQCDRAGALNFDVNLMRRPYDPGSRFTNDMQLIMDGSTSEKGIRYSVAVQVKSDGVLQTVGDCLRITGATNAVLLVSATTSFRDLFPPSSCCDVIMRASSTTYEKLLARHTDDVRALYDRTTLSFATTPVSLPTDRRLSNMKNDDNDIGLEALAFNFGRYLLIASSRKGSMPANLQGIWNDSFTPPWESGYTVNINIQMNYWPACVTGLEELCLPLFDFIEASLTNGRAAARQMYHARGFVAHHNMTIWGNAAPTGAEVFIWPFGAAWLCLHAWDYYRFTSDLEFLRKRGYPLLKESAEFFVDFLVEDENGYMISGVTQSPENSYRLDDGQVSSIARTCTMDNAILRALFNACIKSAQVLGVDSGFADKLSSIIKKLAPYKTGRKGQLLEWEDEYDEIELGHRHLSHLFGLYPGDEITPERTPNLAEACRRSMDIRVGNSSHLVGWGAAWLVSLCARLYLGNTAESHLQTLLKTSLSDSLLDIYPPNIFQIDANFGLVAGIAEMLIQSHAEYIQLLPALPDHWPDGEVTGLRARGAVTVDMVWNDHRLVRAKLTSREQNTIRIRAIPLMSVSCDDCVLIDGKWVVEAAPNQSFYILRNA